MHSYFHNIKTFDHATRHLTRVERALYRDAIELYYDTEKPLPSDFDWLCRRLIATTEEEKAALKYILDEFFTLTGDVYSHDYCDEEIESYRSNKKAKSLAGKASAKARADKAESRKQQRVSKNQQTLNECSTEREQNPTNQEPVTSNHKPRKDTVENLPKRKTFTPPTLEEVSSYCRERGNSISPERWHDYYSANGWKVGKNPMKDWKAAVRTWENNDSQKPTDGPRGLSSKVLN